MKTMKLLAAVALANGLLSAFADSAQAVPVLNESVSTIRSVTIFPDHADPNLFYIAPSLLGICTDETGAPRFSYQDLKVKTGTHGIVQTVLCAQYRDEELAEAKAFLTGRNPAVRFASMPFISSKIIFNTVLEPFVAKEFCTHAAGLVGDAQTCAFRLNNAGRKVFLRNALERVAMTHQFEYTVSGFIKMPDGTFTPQVVTNGLAAIIGGGSLRNFPQLFSDVNGRPLKLK